MKHSFWLTIVMALAALAATARADSIDYSGAGSLTKGTAFVSGSVTAGATWGVLDQLVQIDNETTGRIERGVLGSVSITTGTLMSCASGLCFTGGDLTIMGKNFVIKDSFLSGTVSVMAGNTFLNAVLTDGATVLLEDTNGNFSSDSTITRVSATTPEPAALLLFGPGLLGVGFMARRRIRHA